MRGGKMSQMDHFAEYLSEHVLEADATPERKAHPGGHVAQSAARLGLDRDRGNAFLQRMRKSLGWQAV